MKTALIHDWIPGMGNAEGALELIYKMYPNSIHTAAIATYSPFVAGLADSISTNWKANTFVQKIVRFEDSYCQAYNIHPVSSINIWYINWGYSLEAILKDNNWLTCLGIGGTQPLLHVRCSVRNFYSLLCVTLCLRFLPQADLQIIRIV